MKFDEKKAIVFTMAALLFSMISHSADYVWVNGCTDWGSNESYRDGSGQIPSALPGEEDILNFPDDVNLVISSDNVAALERLNKIKYVLLGKATLTFDCADVVKVNCGIKSLDSEAKVIKKGKGSLELGAMGMVPTNNDYWYDSYVNFDIEEGTLKLYQNEITSKTMLLRNVSVGKDGVLWINTKGSLQLANLFGSGLVTNDCAVADGAYLKLNGANGCFSGDIHGKFTMHVNGGRIDLLGENNWWSDTMLLNGATIGLKRIGSNASGSLAPGSAGTGDLSSRAGSGGIVYLGEGETTTRKFTVWNRPSAPFVFDAGAKGGLTMLGSFAMIASSAWQGMYHLLLTGSNTTECTFYGKIAERTYSSTNYAFYVSKEGSGTWYFKDPTNNVERAFGGVVEVKNGILKFDSVAEKGVDSSLGKANRLSSQKTGFPRDSSKDVDYAYVIGDVETEGMLEFVGTNNCRTTTRPAVLNGVGGFVNNSTNSELRLRGVSALTSGSRTLVLGGTNTTENIVWDVMDGEGTVSVEKRGSGTWVLGGTNSFSGSLTVKDGTLVIRNDKGTAYKWFKFIIRQIASVHPDIGIGEKQSADDAKKISVVEWGLYDANNRRININADKAEVYKKPFRTLRPGQIAIGKDAELDVSGSYANGNYRGPGEMIDGTADSMQIFVNYTAPTLENPDSWVPVVMRLPENVGTVASYDVYYPNIGNDNYRGRNVSAFSIEGSVDGYRWETLVETNDVISLEKGEGWLGSNKKWNFGDRYGLPIRGTATNDCHSLANVSTVSVASGATLKIEGDIVLSDITVDCSAGAGVIDGARFAESGVLRLEGAVKNGDRIPLTCINTETLANVLAWDVTSSGRPSHYKAKVSRQGTLRVYSPTFSVIIR